MGIPMTKGTHEYVDDPRNAEILVYVNGELVPRAKATVSVFDSGFVLGDGVWEGLRLHRGCILFLDAHLDRLYAGAKALDFDIGLDRAALAKALYRTVEANAMHDDVHIRLMVTRGLKATPYQDPRVTVGAATIVIVAEHKQPRPEIAESGVRLATVHVRRGPPDVQDPKINSHSKLNCILACIQATKAGADEALMLDPHGMVATCNSTHFFVVRGAEVWTSTGNYCLAGITRANVIALCHRHGIPVAERDFSLFDVYSADEAFVTGTFAGVVPVIEVDGRSIGAGTRGTVTARLQEHYRAFIDAECAVC